MPDIPIMIIALVIPAVIGLTTMLKDVGLSSRWAGPVAIILGIASMGGYTLWGDLAIFENILIGILVGLGASGFYDLAKLVGTPAHATIVEQASPAAEDAVTEVVTEYAVGINAPAHGWSNEPPLTDDDEALWQRTRVTYTDGRSVTGPPAQLARRSH